MKRTVLSLSALFFLALPAAAADSISSPAGKTVVQISVEAGEARYSVRHEGATLIAPSPLGLETSYGKFTAGLTLVRTQPAQPVEEHYRLPVGKHREADVRANEAVWTLRNPQGQELDVIFRVADQSVAFAYRLNPTEPRSFVVEREETGFALPAGATGFLHPMDVSQAGWSRTFPSYEAHYAIDIPVGQASPTGQGWCFPALFRVGAAGWVLISETNVDGGYCGSHLGHDSTGGLYRLAFPQVPEHRPDAPVAPTVTAPFQSPWRLLIVGRTLHPIVASTAATDLAPPVLRSDKVFAPGRAAWSWLRLKDGQTVYPVQKEFVDLAATLHFEYVLVDALWDTQIGREKIAELARYAATKNVGLILWYNSNGNWNEAPQTPKNCVDTPEARAKEMAWLQAAGIKGIKVDFFGGDKQAVMRLYQDILRDAERHGLAVNFHGATVPRGWERMYPNLLTTEAVMGMEFCTFEQANADAQPQHCTVLPFTRNVVAPMDFTPCVLRPTLSDGRQPVQRRTSVAFELALPVLFFSGIQHFGLVPQDLREYPEFVWDYLRQVPATWDETRLLDGYPGQFAVLARRKDQSWYVAAVNGTATDRVVKLDLAFAGSAAWTMLSDRGPAAVEKTAPALTSAGTLELTLPPNGGAVLFQGTIYPHR